MSLAAVRERHFVGSESVLIRLVCTVGELVCWLLRPRAARAYYRPVSSAFSCFNLISNGRQFPSYRYDHEGEITHIAAARASAMHVLVFSKITVSRQLTGSRLRLATVSSGAALSRETQEFVTLALVSLRVRHHHHKQYDCVGLPFPPVEIRPLDVPEAGYFATNSSPQGEILVQGASITSGHYKRDDLNGDVIIVYEGRLVAHTGDVGQRNKNGTLCRASAYPASSLLSTKKIRGRKSALSAEH